VENFEEADKENINIKFTTIQQLHIDLNKTKENSITIEDFSEEMVDKIQQTSTVSIVQKAFQFFDTKGISSTEIAKRIKANFKEEN